MRIGISLKLQELILNIKIKRKKMETGSWAAALLPPWIQHCKWSLGFGFRSPDIYHTINIISMLGS